MFVRLVHAISIVLAVLVSIMLGNAIGLHDMEQVISLASALIPTVLVALFFCISGNSDNQG
jgi:hypothetical protein